MSDQVELAAIGEPAVRVNVAQGAKGDLKFEATARADTPEQAAELLLNAFVEAQKRFRDRGYELTAGPSGGV